VGLIPQYNFIADLLADVSPPKEGILSRVLQKDEHVNITLFGFSPGQELSTHSTPTPAVLYFLSGEADVKLGEDPSSQGGVICIHAADAPSCYLG
jgi:quercetin dioxygenase-like cupin family protein